MAPIIDVTAIDYPESDGRPMGETDEHRDAMVRHIELLRECFRGQQVYVSGDLLVYYEQGNPKKFVVPDAFIVKGLDPKRRRTYKIWVERKAPDLVIETTSRKTKRKDTQVKPELFARLGVKEYFLFDPLSEYLDPPLQGYRLVGGEYERVEADTEGRLPSDELNVHLRAERGRLEFYRMDTGERILTPEEGRAAAEAEVERLREELRRR